MTDTQARPRPRVLVAHDGSEASQRALERVARFMKDAEVALVTVARPIYRDPPYTGYADPSEEEKQRAVLHAARDALARAGITATGFAPVGDPADEIVATAKTFGAELVVIGARSLGTVGRLVLGSVSTKVMHESDCDVLVVK
ncbi:MAG: universal stress protein [Actinomycetota bacterium]|nr:universal stress protein [Actinomycetota bacterium]